MEVEGILTVYGNHFGRLGDQDLVPAPQMTNKVTMNL